MINSHFLTVNFQEYKVNSFNLFTRSNINTYVDCFLCYRLIPLGVITFNDVKIVKEMITFHGISTTCETFHVNFTPRTQEIESV